MPEIIKQNSKHILFASIFALLLVAVIVFIVQKDSEAQSFRDTDLNQDGVVDQVDVGILRTAFDTQDPAADFNNNGTVDTYDLFMFNQDYGDGDSEERDFDGDKYSVLDHDCDDTNPDIHPFKPEEANGIDDNCNGAIDEFVDYEPITTNLWYEVPVHFSSDENNNYVATVDQSNVKLIDYGESVTNIRSPGSFAFVLRDSLGDVVDVVTVGLPKSLPVEAGGTSLGTDVVARQEGREYVYVPFSSEVSEISFVNVSNPDSASVTPLDISQQESRSPLGAAEAQWQLCPDEYRPTSGINGVQWCKTDLSPDELDDLLTLIYEDIGGLLPELTWYGMSQFEAYSTRAKTASVCSTPLSPGCYFWDANRLVIWYTDDPGETDLERILAHELGHRFEDTFHSDLPPVLDLGEDGPPSDRMPPGASDLIEFLQSIRADMVETFNEAYCDEGDEMCSFNPQELITLWNRGNPPSVAPVWEGGCEFLVCIENRPQDKYRDDVYVDDPLIGSVALSFSPFQYSHDERFDHLSGPRPFKPGNVSAYGTTTEVEGFAEFYASLYKDLAGLGTDGGEYLPGLCTIFEKHFSAGSNYSFQVKIQSLEGLVEIVKLFGQHGIVKDRNHNGIPDSCDPEAEPTETLSCLGGTWCSGSPDSERHQVCQNSLVDVPLSHPNMKPGCKGLIRGSGTSLGSVVSNGCAVNTSGSPNDSSSRPVGGRPPGSWQQSAGFGRGAESPCGGSDWSTYVPGGCTLEGSDGEVSVDCWRSKRSPIPSYGRW